MREDSFKYGMPLLCAEWLSSKIFLIGGGGGTAATGIHNRVLLAKFEDGIMSDQLVEISLGSQTPVRSARHPTGADVVLGMTDKGVKHLKFNTHTSTPSIRDDTESPLLDAFDNIEEEVLCLKFSDDGQWLIAGFSGGWIQIWRWPEMHVRIKLREDAVYTALKDLDVASGPDSKFLVVSTAKGTAEVWHTEEGKQIHELPRPSGGGRYVHCRFLPVDKRRIFYTTLLSKTGSSVWKWQLIRNDALKLLRKARIGSEAISACCVSRRVMAFASSEGNIQIHSTNRMLPMQRIDGAHMIFTTAISFSPVDGDEDPAEVLSISGDASAKVTRIMYKNETELWIRSMTPYLLLNLLLVLIAVLLLRNLESLDLTNFQSSSHEEL